MAVHDFSCSIRNTIRRYSELIEPNNLGRATLTFREKFSLTRHIQHSLPALPFDLIALTANELHWLRLGLAFLFFSLHAFMCLR